MRRCPIDNCRETIPDSRFACYAHWKTLTKQQQNVIYESYNAYLAKQMDIEELRSIQNGILEEIKAGKQPTLELERCRSCNATIRWVRVKSTGTLMPINSEPDPRGNIVLKDNLAHFVKAGLFDEEVEGISANAPRYISHFASCPNAKKHRRGKR